MREPNTIEWGNLREDLALLPAASGRTGAPRWLIHDPSAGKFYKIGWLEFEMLKRWHLKDAKTVLTQIERETLLHPTEQDLIEFHQFLKTSNLLVAHSHEDTQLFLQSKQMAKGGPLMQKAMKNYLFFRVPLIYPDKWLDRILPHVLGLFTKTFFLTTLCAALLGAFLVLRNAPEFISAFSVLKNPVGILMGLIVIAFSKMVHEFGHAIMCKKYNCHVPSMGVAFIVFWPLLWTDTTDSWRLTNHRQRLNISAAGMMAELSLAAYASILWAIAPDGVFKDAMHILAGVTWTITLLVNLNPFMRFDGYYLLSDFLDIPNLQERSFRLAKNWIRKLFWGMNSVNKEPFSASLQSGLIIYAILTWIYRFFLFLGIALLVYNYFFKALGLFLMLVELWWFIGRPIYLEIKFWFDNKESMHMPLKRKFIYGTALCSLMAFLFLPWQKHITAPAIIKSTVETPLFSSHSGVIKIKHVSSGDSVEPSQSLFEISNPDLQHEILQSQQKLRSLQTELKEKSADSAYSKQSQLLETQIAEQQADLSLKQSTFNELQIKASDVGIITDIPEHLEKNSWISHKEYLGLIRSKDVNIEAFISASDIGRIAAGNSVLFYPINAISPIKGQISKINIAPSKHIPYPQMSAHYGGDIAAAAANMDANTQPPRDTLYLVTIKPDQALSNVLSNLSVTGQARIEAKSKSIGHIYTQKILSLLIRESSF